MRALRIAFVVQGEGRGHMTQALALESFLREAGHEVVSVWVGTGPHRSVPEYVATAFGVPVRHFAAPAQVPDREGHARSAGRTAADLARRGPQFFRSIFDIAEATREVDVVVNFLDLMGAFSTLVNRRTPTVAVAHNYVFLHPDFSDAPGPTHARGPVLAYARLTAAGSVKKIALAFEPHPTRDEQDLEVAPPLLRSGLSELDVGDDGFLLAYALNPGYAKSLARWQRRHPEVEVHCYVQGGPTVLSEPPGADFHLHELDGEQFLLRLARCRGYVGSAGFESICEAHYLGKPTLAVPTEGHFEQTLNAWDAQRAGVARAGSYDDLDDFWANPQGPSEAAVARFRSWVARAPGLMVDAVERAAAATGEGR